MYKWTYLASYKIPFLEDVYWLYNKQAVLILQVCKVECDDSKTLINIQDRGGLRGMNKTIKMFTSLFKNAKKYFDRKHLSITLKFYEVIENISSRTVL